MITWTLRDRLGLLLSTFGFFGGLRLSSFWVPGFGEAIGVRVQRLRVGA